MFKSVLSSTALIRWTEISAPIAGQCRTQLPQLAQTALDRGCAFRYNDLHLATLTSTSHSSPLSFSLPHDRVMTSVQGITGGLATLDMPPSETVRTDFHSFACSIFG